MSLSFQETLQEYFLFDDFHDHISDIISRRSSDFNNLTPLREFNTNHVHFNVVKEEINARKLRRPTLH